MAHSMADPESEEKDKKISWVNIDAADNGYIVRWDEQEEKPKGSMDHCHSKNHTRLFSEGEDDLAWEHFKMLKMKELGKMK